MTAVQIATFGSSSHTSGGELNVDVVKRIIQEYGIENLPIIPVAIAGNARTGKTFLLNFMVEFLEYMSKSGSEAFRDSGAVITGMDWAGGPDGVTKGILLWEKPFIIKREDGSKFAILLLDTQGIGDGIYSADPQVDNQIIYLTLSIATIYIHNVDKIWKHSERMIYQICKSFKDLFGDDNQSGGNLFHSFTLLFRNWVHDNIFGLRSEIFKNEVRKTQGHIEASKILDGIDKLFNHKTAWVLPEPSDVVRTCQGGFISVSDIGPDFLKYLEEFILQLISNDGIYSQHIEYALTGRKFIVLLEDLSDRLKEWPDLTKEEEQLKDIYLSKAYQSAKESFENELKSVERNEEIEVIDELLENAERSACSLFKHRSRKVMPADKFYSHYYEKLLKEIKHEEQLCKSAAEIRIAHRKLEETKQEMKKLNEEVLKMKEQSEKDKQVLEQEMESLIQKSECEKQDFENKISCLEKRLEQMNTTSGWDRGMRILEMIADIASVANMGMNASSLYKGGIQAQTAAVAIRLTPELMKLASSHLQKHKMNQ